MTGTSMTAAPDSSSRSLVRTSRGSGLVRYVTKNARSAAVANRAPGTCRPLHIRGSGRSRPRRRIVPSLMPGSDLRGHLPAGRQDRAGRGRGDISRRPGHGWRGQPAGVGCVIADLDLAAGQAPARGPARRGCPVPRWTLYYANVSSINGTVKIDHSSPVPLHEQVAAASRRAIADGEAPAGRPLPPASDLAALPGVNANTVFRGLRTLRAPGLAASRPAPGPPCA